MLAVSQWNIEAVRILAVQAEPPRVVVWARSAGGR